MALSVSNRTAGPKMRSEATSPAPAASTPPRCVARSYQGEPEPNMTTPWKAVDTAATMPAHTACSTSPPSTRQAARAQYGTLVLQKAMRSVRERPATRSRLFLLAMATALEPMRRAVIASRIGPTTIPLSSRCVRDARKDTPRWDRCTGASSAPGRSCGAGDPGIVGLGSLLSFTCVEDTLHRAHKATGRGVNTRKSSPNRTQYKE
eukprot:scaffold2006_cov141-Isochrysis_galbana.AAC.2